MAFYFDISLPVLALAVLVLLTRNAVLRTREVYADVAASTWDGPMGALNRVLEHLPRQGRSRWWDMVQTHPDPKKRQLALVDTWPLFQIGFWTALGTGVAAVVSIEGVTNLFDSLAESLQSSFPSPVAAGLIFGVLATGVVGSGIWRATFAARTQGKTPPDIGRVALGMMLGIVVGRVLSLSSVGASLPTFNTIGSFLADWTVWCLLLLLSLLFVLQWIVTTATTWLEITASRSTLRWSFRLALILAGGAWAVWFGLLWLGGTFFSIGFGDIDLMLNVIWLSLTSLIVIQPLALIGLISLWALPLAAWFWRKQLITPAELGWAWLDRIPEQEIRSPQELFQLRLPLLIGIAGSLLFSGLLLALHLWLRLTVPEVIRGTATFKQALASWSFSRAALIQAGVAIVIAAWTPRFGALHGLFAAFIGGCVMAIGLLSLNLLFGGTIGPSFTWMVFNSIVVSGGLLALLVAPAVAALAIRVSLALRSGLAGGLTICALVLCISIGMQFIFHETTRSTDQIAYIVGSVIFGLIYLLPLVVAAIVTTRVSYRSIRHGLFAAFVAGCIGGGSILLIPDQLGSLTLPLIGQYMLIAGLFEGLLALPIVLLVAVIARQMRRSRRTTAEDATSVAGSPGKTA